MRIQVFFFVLFLFVKSSFCQCDWHGVGPDEDVTSSPSSFNSFAFDSNDIPYIAYSDLTNGNRLTVRKYINNYCARVGTDGFTGAQVDYVKIALNSNVPYVAFKDYANGGKLSVMNFNGSSWNYVGTPGITSSSAEFIDFSFDGLGVPYVAFKDFANGRKVSVMNFNGTNWNYVGTPGFSSGPADHVSMDIDNTGVIYVTYSDSSNSSKACVMSYSLSSWSTIGSNSLSIGNAKYTSISVYGGEPFITYSDAGIGGKDTVIKFNGSIWVNVGSSALSTTLATHTKIKHDPSGVPFVIYSDWSNGGKERIKKFVLGSWANVGTAAFTSGPVNYPSIAFNSTGNPFVFLSDQVASNQFLLLKYTTSSSSSWLPYFVQNMTGMTVNYHSPIQTYNNIPYVAYRDPQVSCNFLMRKFINEDWVQVGPPVSTGCPNVIKFGLNKIGEPYVFTDNTGVMKYDGSSWVSVGWPFIGGGAVLSNLVVDTNDVPIISYQQGSGLVEVKKYDGSNWVSIGPAITSTIGLHLYNMVLDKQGSPHLLLGDPTGLNVMKFDGTNWVHTSSVTITYPSWPTNAAMGLDNTGNPVVAYLNLSSTLKIVKLNGSNWSPVGSLPSIYNGGEPTKLIVDKAGNILVCTRNLFFLNGCVQVLLFDGANWNNVGGLKSASVGLGNTPDMALDENGSIYVDYDFGGLWVRKILGDPTVTSQPIADSICSGDNKIFSMSAVGLGLNYQWQVDSGFGFSNLPNNLNYSGVYTGTLNILNAPLSFNQFKYRCAITDSCGISAATNSAKLTVNPCVGIEEITKNKLFSFYPNPTSNILYIKNASNNEIEVVTVFDITGRKVLEQKGSTLQINIQSLEQGMYQLQIISVGKKYSSKFIKG